MGRLGVAPARALALVKQVRRLPGLSLQGVLTHFAAAAEDAEFSHAQRQRFEQVLAQLAAAGVDVPLVHASNSGALLHEPAARYNLVRPGLLVYGIVPPGTRRSETSIQDHLRPALAWKCRVSLVKEVPRGATLSYGRTFIAPRRLRVATLTAGYGDGYLRAASGHAQVLVGGRRCPVLGCVTMDQMLVDVSRVRGVKTGDEAVLIGRQGREAITAPELAVWCGTIPWEVLTGITYRVPRVYRGGQAA